MKLIEFERNFSNFFLDNNYNFILFVGKFKKKVSKKTKHRTLNTKDPTGC